MRYYHMKYNIFLPQRKIVSIIKGIKNIFVPKINQLLGTCLPYCEITNYGGTYSPEFVDVGNIQYYKSPTEIPNVKLLSESSRKNTNTKTIENTRRHIVKMTSEFCRMTNSRGVARQRSRTRMTLCSMQTITKEIKLHTILASTENGLTTKTIDINTEYNADCDCDITFYYFKT